MTPTHVLKHNKMKPQRFKIGQAVTPKVNMQWPINMKLGYLGILPKNAPTPIPEMPKQGEIYHVDGYQAYDDGIWGIFLSEYNHELTFNEEKFDPIEMTTKEVADLINETIHEQIPSLEAQWKFITP